MKPNYGEVVECGDKLYYDINPDSKMDVPSFFYERLEEEWLKWKKSSSALSFYDYCKKEISDKKKS
jgi:hypothetical protein